MSDENDDYTQQHALMLAADRFIAVGRNDSALETVDFAFQRAGKFTNFSHKNKTSSKKTTTITRLK